MKMHTKLVLIALLACMAHLHAGGGDTPPDQTKTANLCQGVMANCILGNITVGEAGDIVSFDTTGLKIKNYGRLTKPLKVTLQISQAGKSLFTLTPTQGAQAERQIKVLFYAFDIDNMPKDLSNPKLYTEANDGKTKFPWAKTMLKTYRQLDGEQQWTEMIASFSQTTFDKMKPISAELFADGRVNVEVAPHQGPDGTLVPVSTISFDLTKTDFKTQT